MCVTSGCSAVFECFNSGSIEFTVEKFHTEVYKHYSWILEVLKSDFLFMRKFNLAAKWRGFAS